jgi:hypothetical protein
MLIDQRTGFFLNGRQSVRGLRQPPLSTIRRVRSRAARIQILGDLPRGCHALAHDFRNDGARPALTRSRWRPRPKAGQTLADPEHGVCRPGAPGRRQFGGHSRRPPLCAPIDRQARQKLAGALRRGRGRQPDLFHAAITFHQSSRVSTLLTCTADHSPWPSVGMPRSFKSAAIVRSVVFPATGSSPMIGARSAGAPASCQEARPCVAAAPTKNARPSGTGWGGGLRGGAVG